MSGTLFFVHGTGVRQQRYELLLAQIREGCATQPRLKDVSVFDDCSWGEAVGAKIDLIPKTLPPPARSIEAGVAPPDATETALWSFLLSDPLFELRIISQGEPNQEAGIAIGRMAPGAQMVEDVNRLATAPPAGLPADIPASAFTEAARFVAGAPELERAAEAAGTENDAALVEAVARAIVASVIGRVPEEARPSVATSVSERDALVSAVAGVLAPSTRGAVGWVKERVTGVIAGLATQAMRGRREPLTGGATPSMADIFLHLRRGGAVEYIIEQMARCEPPIVAVGHSLGGVMLVDMLSREEHPDVAKLVTVGSQAPLFFAVDALERLRPSDQSARPFVPWLNIYDRNDFLSFVAQEIFELDGIEDEEVSSGVPFPDSHSAYWTQPRTYELLDRFWPAM